ncbi:MAG: hypothetical protein HY526_11215, partial [Betaproteobacteria bacterium]|nr:hypothetical protein [Betaproteobacteria bacterium]
MNQYAIDQRASIGPALSRQCPSPAFVLLSFEGPDAYSRAGGLGARVSGLACA